MSVWDQAGQLIQPECGGQLLGLFPDPTITHHTVQIPPGGMLLLYTDGATEARNSQGEFLEEEGLADFIAGCLERPSQELCDSLVEAVLDYQLPLDPADDITLIAAKANT